MQGAETDTDGAEQLAHARPVVERWLVWSGIVPLPAFLLLHLTCELSRAFASDPSEVVRSPTSGVELVLSVLLVWSPLCVHVLLGAWLTLGTRPRLAAPLDVPRLPRLMSLIAGGLSGAFLLYHALAFPVAVWLGEADARDAGFRLIGLLSSTRGGVPLSAAAYLFGVLATSTHAALGVHRGLLLEGLLRNPARRLASARLCAALGVLSFTLGAAAVIRVASGVLLR